MDDKSPEVHETQLLDQRDGYSENEGRKGLIPWLKQSKHGQCSFNSAHRHGWKPLTLSAPVLFPFAFSSLILSTILEVLAQQSQKNGGLALSDSVDDIPRLASYSYLFLPTTVAVIYSLLWSWIDLDVKRIQPWLGMSDRNGAAAEHSVFLDYPYDFVAIAPLKAAKRRHWAVFYGGTVMVIIFWLITPLQSAILGTGSVNVLKAVPIVNRTVFRGADEQILNMDQSLLNEGYAVTWLNQPYPAFTTPEYTILPFTASTEAPRISSTNWTGPSTKYWTSLECWPASVSKRPPAYDFDNGRGCNASEITPYNVGVPRPEQPYRMQYIGYQSSPWADYWLASSTCSKAAAHQFLAIWAREKNEVLDVSAVFCETSYFKQEVNVTVSSNNRAPLDHSIVPLGPRERLPETEFNITAFEHLLGAGVSSVEMDVKREHPFGHLLEQFFQVRDLGLTWPMSPMVGFALGSRNVTTLDIFQNETALGEAFNATHKRLFTLALQRMLTNGTEEVVSSGTVTYVQHGIIVSRLFSALVEGFLAIVALFTVMLWWHNKRAASQLTADPASLGSLLSMCQNSSVLLDKFAGKGCVSEQDLKVAFEGYRFHLLCGCESRSGHMVIKVVDNHKEFVESQHISPEPDLGFPVSHYNPVKPLALRRDVGALVVLVMLGAVAALVYLRVVEQRIGGLIRPNASFEVLQILENYIPTVFATLLEPFWVLVNRLLCIIQPFTDLWYGHQSAKGSIDARYTSVPPQLVFWRAIRSGHFVLSAICAVALLSNLLAVGLGGLFNELPIVASHPRQFQQSMMPKFRNDTLYGQRAVYDIQTEGVAYEIPLYIAMNNISQGTPLPPWVTNDYFFQPFTATLDGNLTGGTLTATTRGFGVEPSCSVRGVLKSNGSGPVINYTFSREGQLVKGCPTTFRPSTLDFNESNVYLQLPSPASGELVDMLSRPFKLDICHVPLLLGWARTLQVGNGDVEMETSLMVCEPLFTTAMFDVTIDQKGYVLKSEQVSESSPTLDYPESTNHTDAVSAHVNHLFQKLFPDWHNDTLSQDWTNYLLKVQSGKLDMLDPFVTPDAAELIAPMETIYRLLHSILLSLNQNFFDEYPEPVTIDGIQSYTEVRIFINQAAFIISLSVLGLNIIVAIALYGHAIKHFLPRMPTTIGSILAYIAPSRAVREYDAQKPLDQATFSFGRYVGEDGRAHVGIELDPYVVPVKLSSLRKGDTEPRRGLVRRVLGRRKTEQGDTWL